jgi:hypothetical protein
MSSFKSKMFNFLIRTAHLMGGQVKQEIFDMNASIKVSGIGVKKELSDMLKLKILLENVIGKN